MEGARYAPFLCGTYVNLNKCIVRIHSQEYSFQSDSNCTPWVGKGSWYTMCPFFFQTSADKEFASMNMPLGADMTPIGKGWN